MNKIVIIGANDFQNQLILKAKSLGYETHVFAWEEGAVGKTNADYFYPVSITEKEEILRYCKSIRPKGIVSIASDLASITVNYLSKQLGHRACNGEECIRKSTNKFEMRKAFEEAGIPTPQYKRVGSIDEVEANSLRFPVIVKPTDRSGSRAITKVNKIEDLKKAIDCAVENSFEHMSIIETYLQGDEFSCESISYEGEHNILTFTRKFTTDAPHFIETGHVQPAGLSNNIADRASIRIKDALNALGIKFGASHTEFRVDQSGQIWIIEIGARMGGDCIGSDLVPLSTGFDFMKMVIEIATGREPEFHKSPMASGAAIHFIFNERDYKVIQNIRKSYPNNVYRFTLNGGIGSHMVTDSSSRYGYAIFVHPSLERLQEWVQA